MLQFSRRDLLAFSTLLAGSGSLLAASESNTDISRSKLQVAAQDIVDTVMQQLKKEGRPAKYRPIVRVRTEPYLIGIGLEDAKIPELVLPMWEEAGDMQTLFADLTRMAGIQVSPRIFFEDTFNWALIAHEMGHHFAFEQVAKDKRLNFFGEERQANQFMVAFWNTQPGARTRLDRCGEVWDALYTRMPSPVPKGSDAEEYFNKNYRQLSEDPMAYGWYQFKWMAEAWRVRDQLVFAEVLKLAIAGKSIA